MQRTLTVKKEALTELPAGDLADVVGGTRPVTITRCIMCDPIPTTQCD